MDKEAIVLIIARNGLDTAQAVLEIKAAEAVRAAEKLPDGPEKKKLLATAKKRAKLVKALNAAETGLNEYLAETIGL